MKDIHVIVYCVKCEEPLAFVQSMDFSNVLEIEVFTEHVCKQVTQQ